MEPQEAISYLRKEFNKISERVYETKYNEKDTIEFNRLFLQWLDEELDLKVEERTWVKNTTI